ncbi:hypothetical protein RYY48_006506 [Pseudomonas aeruginosa]|nr:hypothetical protein [Pseudomonas aeruginosa]ELM3781561.1 hypothetical protein [Pseudomonas aeruginosa]ELM3845679.1 hypothetical protein [Pseudomonas aeruginosa]ELM3846305.1 hypothetical protein [Pseudomonas aeruginosa]ELP2775955.1 hypothetical protein [Pseudomonas aeruginosa]
MPPSFLSSSPAKNRASEGLAVKGEAQGWCGPQRSEDSALRAIAHIRKSGLVIENLEAYLTRPAPVQESTETSLRLMHTQRVALINGEPVDLSPQVYLFLKILEDADGDEVHKRHMAEGLGLEPGTSFRTAGVFKRHKQVYTTFVDKDDKGHYWLKPDFVILERG